MLGTCRFYYVMKAFHFRFCCRITLSTNITWFTCITFILGLRAINTSQIESLADSSIKSLEVNIQGRLDAMEKFNTKVSTDLNAQLEAFNQRVYGDFGKVDQAVEEIKEKTGNK